MNSGAPGSGYRQSGCRRPDNQATSASRRSHRVKPHPSSSERRLTTNEACYTPRRSQRSVTSRQSFDSLVDPKQLSKLKEISDRHAECYDGKSHSKFATKVKDYTSNCKRSLNHYEQTKLVSVLKAFGSSSHWSWRSLTTYFHSLTKAGVFTPRSDQALCDDQEALLTGLLNAVRHQCQQETDARGIDAQGLANLLWAVAKLIQQAMSDT